MPSVDTEPALLAAPVGVEESSATIGVATPTSNPRKSLAVKTYIMLLLMMIFGTAGNVLLDRGMKELGVIDISSSATIWAGMQRILVSGAIWLGIAFMLVYMLCNMLVLSWADYSFVMPFTAISYVLVALTGYIWLGEAVSATRWLGIALIVAGVFLISRTPHRTTGPPNASAD
jgi:drug/metabolite transporter (DMT)-like permease